ncbi:MAG: HDIG domain-containing protein, partial [Chloroflexi bacterium]|nr:HDIG domain-containing protein [Chloroflexota bacterium]
MATRPLPHSIHDAARNPARRSTAITVGVLSSIALFAVLFPWYPGSQRLEAGVTLDQPITSPRDLTYESAVLTEQVRSEAASAINDVLILDPEIRDRQLQELDRILEAIRVQRDTPDISASARETQIRAIPGVQISQPSASVLASVDGSRWDSLRSEAQNALSRTLTGAVGPEETTAARGRAAGYLSPLLEVEEVLALTELLDPLIVPTLIISAERTESLRREARANTPPVVVTYSTGQVVIPSGTVIDAVGLEAIERFGLRHGTATRSAIMAAALAAALAGTAVGAHLYVARPRALRGARRLTLLILLLVVPAALAKFVLTLTVPDADRLFLALALPLAAGPIVAVVLLDIGTAVLLSALLAAIVGFVSVSIPVFGWAGTASQLETLRLTLGALAGGLAGIYAVARVERMQGYMAAGLMAGGATALVATAVLMVDPDWVWLDLVWIAGTSAVGGVVAAMVAVGAFVLLSRPFGIVTRVELMELAQLNHPLLRRLQDEAPGTFQHSMVVGNLAERAADRIGADALLVRVGAYYHDVGKLHSPAMFVENFGSGASPHEALDPLQSCRVIMLHVSAGVEIAHRYDVPDAVVQFIPQHHGTRLVAYFYRLAAQTAPDIDPDLFRYAGPKPQTRETALVMLADSCEATVRAAPDRSGDKIREIVEGIIRERLEEGQFDECDLSLRDLRVVADSFVVALGSVYHPRV